jgi:hypothetical protein
MPLTYTPVPPEVTDAARQGVAGLHALDQTIPGRKEAAGPAEPTLGTALPAYSLSLKDLNAAAGPEAAALSDWRIVVGSGGQANRYADVSVAGGGKPKFRSLREGPVAGAILEAVNRATARPEAANADLTPRVLAVPGLPVRFLWLRAARPEASLFLALPPAYAPLKPYQVLDANAVMAALRQMAASQQRLEMPPRS